MAFLAKDNHLSVLRLLPLTLHPALQGQHHRTRRVNDCDVIALGRFVGRGWFAMGSEQHRCIVKLLKLFMIDGDQSLVSKTFHLDTVVYDVAKAVEGLCLPEFFSSALLMAVVTPKQKPLPESISIVIGWYANELNM